MSGAVGQVCPDCGKVIKKGEMVVFRGGQWRHATHEVKKPTAKELFGGTVLDGYLEAARTRNITEFTQPEKEEHSDEVHTYHFLMDEGLPTEEKIKVEATGDMEAAIKARDEFTKRRGRYHMTSRMTSKHSNGASERKLALPWDPQDYAPIERKELPTWSEGFYVMSFFDPQHATHSDNYWRSKPFSTVDECLQKAKALGVKQCWLYQYDVQGIFIGAVQFVWSDQAQKWQPSGYNIPKQKPTLTTGASRYLGLGNLKGKTVTWEATWEPVGGIWKGVVTDDIGSWVKVKVISPQRLDEPQSLDKKHIRTVESPQETQGSMTLLADVEKWLRDMFEDETKAVNEYKTYADKMRELGLGDLANRFEQIASDEGRHASIVKEALDAVTFQRRRLEGLQ